MGSSASKAAQKTPRKFPSRPPGTAAPPPPRPARRPAPSPSSPLKASSSMDGAIPADSMDPDANMSAAFAARLKAMGIADPTPTFSATSTAHSVPGPHISQPIPAVSKYAAAPSNVTLSTLEARRKLEGQATAEFDRTGRSTDRGREFLDVNTLRDVLILRDKGIPPADIESKLRLKAGVVKRLGPAEVVSALVEAKS